jgi:photosystem II stability/assembly factor-like uncharacterized protein
MSDTLIVGTRKGTFVFERQQAGWKAGPPSHAGASVAYAARDPRTGTLWASLDHGHWGAKLSRSRDGGRTWEDAPPPKYPQGARYLEFSLADLAAGGDAPPRQTIRDARLLKIWTIAFSNPDREGRLYLGTIPGGLFVSDDDGESWELDRSLWNHESRGGDLTGSDGEGRRQKWFGTPASAGLGEFAPGICAICVDPKDSDHVRVGVSCAGVVETRDGGRTWEGRNKGLKVDFLPEKEPEWGHDIHFLAQCEADPDLVWHQNHVGVYASEDGAATWKKVSQEEQGVHFGWPIAVDEKDGHTAWVVPQRSDAVRMALDSGLFVGRTQDGGATWEPLREGLPQEHCYDTVYRHALDKRGDRLAFGSTNGNLYVSEDRGESWQTLGHHLPPIHSVRFG